MNQLRKKFANLWNPPQREDAVRDQQNGHIRRGSNNSTSSSEVPAALGLDATGPASPGTHARDQQRHYGGLDQDDQRDEKEDKDEAPPRLLCLSNPWGTVDPRPPPGWTSSSSRPVSQRRALNSSSSSVRARRIVYNADGRDENGSANNRASLRVVDLSFPATTTVAPPGSPSTAVAMPAAAGGARNTGRRRFRDGDGEDDERGDRGIGYGGSSASATKRYRATDGERSNGGGTGGGGGSEEAKGSNGRQELQKAFRRRRTCPADSAFVSPSAKRPLGNGASTAAAGTTAVALAAHEDEEELERRRSSTPSRLTFSAGFFKVLRGSRAAAKRARSATKLKRKTRELQASVVRQAFLSAHLEEQEGSRDEGGDGGGEGEERKEEGGPRRSRRGGATGDARIPSLREEDGDGEIWRRINLTEAEHGREAEERAMARVRRLRNLRADALVAFGQAQEARDDLVSTAKTAFAANGGADMTTLRSLFAAGGGDKSSNNPSSRFKDDEEVSALMNKYAALEAVLANIKAIKITGDAAALEAVLVSQEAKNVQNQPEFLAASDHLRTAKEEEEKIRAKQEAQASREAAAAATAAAKAQQEKDKAAAVASARAAAERSTAAAAANAAAIAAQKAKRDKEAEEQEARELAEAAQAAAGAAAAADEGQFSERAEVLKAAVESRRAAVDEIFASTDPGVKKIRMAFKKSYQGCLNKLSATPSTVQQVMRDIEAKAEAPLLEARRAGWEAKAKDFLYFNLADKLVDYSERDHFSGDSYRMAFPLASVAVDLMARHAGLSDLFLGTLYSRCPSAVPALSFDTAGLSDEQVMASLGQMGGEDLPAFLNRTKGLVVLMAAVMQTPPHGGATLSHPLPLAQGWCWLARFVNGLAAYVRKGNAPPVPTGPVLEWFLKVAGFELQRRYGRAFDKVVQTIKVEVLPILLPKAIVPHLLDVVMEDYEGRGRRFLPPAGRDKEFRYFREWGDT